MTYYPDLSPCTYFDRSMREDWWASWLIAVGWLDPAYLKPYAHIPEPDAVLDKLSLFVGGASWRPLTLFCQLGYHPCGFCTDAPEKTPTTVTHKSRTMQLGAGIIYVPIRRKLFVAPDLILHYVLEHSYKPPRQFCAALLSCPLPGTRAYDRAVRRNGPPAFRWLPYDPGVRSRRAPIARLLATNWFEESATGQRLGRLIRRL